MGREIIFRTNEFSETELVINAFPLSLGALTDFFKESKPGQWFRFEEKDGQLVVHVKQEAVDGVEETSRIQEGSTEDRS